MIKKVLILLSSLFMFNCTNVATDGVDETKEDQMARLLEEANKVKTVQKTVINEKGEEVIVEEEVPVEANGRRSHIGMTRGEIMEYEMTRVSEEMNALHADVQQYQEKKAQLNAYQEKLENLKKLNDAGMR
ncbi:FAD-I family protein [Fusobacterium polymorphum]|uniref:FAD-I family protein n=1 Tax=Fusobacterium nucleatum subsp. polymorphum TaxID=76857 RepID=UPI0030D5D15F